MVCKAIRYVHVFVKFGSLQTDLLTAIKLVIINTIERVVNKMLSVVVSYSDYSNSSQIGAVWCQLNFKRNVTIVIERQIDHEACHKSSTKQVYRP